MMMATRNGNNGWHGDMRDLGDKIAQVAVQVERIAASMVTRAEIEAEDAKRVTLEQFTATMAGVNERISRLEGSPQRAVAIISLIISGAVGCLTVLTTIAGLILSLIFWHH